LSPNVNCIVCGVSYENLLLFSAEESNVFWSVYLYPVTQKARF